MSASNRRVSISSPALPSLTAMADLLKTSKVSIAARALGPMDVPLLAITLLLVSFGIVMVYSSSAIFAARSHGSAQYYLLRQASFAPSSDQAGESSKTAVTSLLKFLAPVPSARITPMWNAPPSCLVKAIHCPSGLQTGVV